PTAAFKDFGARFLAFAMSAIIEAKDQRERTILVATSGDTGGAVASAFHKRPGIKVAILYPEGLVSPRQEKQLTCWGDNIVAFKVAGTFDDCQALVKEAFNNSQLREQFGLTSANSINLGRVLPQMAYHAFSSSKFKEERNLIPTLIIPTGNLGNAVGAFWAKRMGSPIANIVLATNANKALPVYFDSGKYKERKSVATLANAMDVGAPSNMERLLHLIPSLEELQKISASYSVSDEEISETISQFYREQELILCPHTAVAMKVWQEHYPTVPSILSATAHPAKFESIVEPLIGQQIPLPAVLQNLIAKNSTALAIAPHLEELISKL
ncbi:MAG: threonine synthase, partial [Halobacteriovoraceae bacterium]|nr:threonine synthase [Halobacteriovoraceae bacterium]